jgi:calcium binding protein 39
MDPQHWSQEMYNTGLLLLLIRNLHRIDFEGKKDVAQIFNSVLRRSIGTRTPTVEYICTTPEILFSLCKGKRYRYRTSFFLAFSILLFR